MENNNFTSDRAKERERRKLYRNEIIKIKKVERWKEEKGLKKRS